MKRRRFLRNVAFGAAVAAGIRLPARQRAKKPARPKKLGLRLPGGMTLVDVGRLASRAIAKNLGGVNYLIVPDVVKNGETVRDGQLFKDVCAEFMYEEMKFDRYATVFPFDCQARDEFEAHVRTSARYLSGIVTEMAAKMSGQNFVWPGAVCYVIPVLAIPVVDNPDDCVESFAYCGPTGVPVRVSVFRPRGANCYTVRTTVAVGVKVVTEARQEMSFAYAINCPSPNLFKFNAEYGVSPDLFKLNAEYGVRFL